MNIFSPLSRITKKGKHFPKRGQGTNFRLKGDGLIEKKQEKLMMAAISDKAIHIPSNIKDKVRASVLQEMLLSILEEG